MANIVIIGAGLTGISTAYYLEQAGFYDYELYEKEKEIGGLCRSIRSDGFTFDYTGHLLHISDPVFHEFIEKTITFDHLNHLERRSGIYNHDIITEYPYQTNLYGLPTDIICDCIEGFIKRKKFNNPKTFYNWVLSHFGKGFGKNFFFPYQEKIFCSNVKKITASWTGRFVPQTSLQEIITGALKKPEKNIGYNAHFYYPQAGGIDQFIHAIKKQLKNSIKTTHNVEKIDLLNKQIIFTNGESTTYTVLINTMPLNEFVKKIGDKSSTSFVSAHEKLHANSVLNVNIGISRSRISDYHWLYTPESQLPFYRLGFSHHFASSMAPQDCSAIYVECSYTKTSPKKSIADILQSLKKFLKIEEKNIVCLQELTIPAAYVTYDFWREKNLPTLLARLNENGIYSIGRYGAWKYSSMQESILDSKYIVDKIIQHVIPKKRSLYQSRKNNIVHSF